MPRNERLVECHKKCGSDQTVVENLSGYAAWPLSQLWRQRKLCCHFQILPSYAEDGSEMVEPP